MATSMETQYPKLRPIDVHPVVQDGRRSLLLRDPLQLFEEAVVIPEQLGPLLALCDGTRDLDGLRASLMVRFGLRVAPDVMARIVTVLDQALLLDNERFAQAREQALAEYREASFRPPSCAGRSYPDDVDELRQALQGYLDGVNGEISGFEGGSGLVSPHIDYGRGGPIYAQVWKRATDIVREADLVIVVGTDHFGSEGRWTLTRQHYATPFGVLPTAREIVDALAGAIGEDAAFAEELHHRSEHSIELAAVWLHYVREGRPCELVPILGGSFSHFVRGEADPAHDPAIGSLVDVLRKTVAERNVAFVAAADLSHVGPAFGGRPQGLVERARLQSADEELIKRICAGDAGGFFEAIRRDGDRRNVCGVPPIYLALRALSPVEGEPVGYDRCPADGEGTSWVSICGVLFR